MLRVAITGSSGQLGQELVNAFSRAGHTVRPLARPSFDITDATHLTALSRWRPNIVINSAAWTDVDGCARDPGRAMRINADAAEALAGAAAKVGARIVQISTNEVFDGTLDRPYLEGDKPNPINPYGASKLAGERGVARANSDHLIIRTAWLFGPTGQNFLTKIHAAAARAKVSSEPLRVVADEWGNPTWTPWLAAAIQAMVESEPAHIGTRHVVGAPATSRYRWAAHALEAVGLVIEPIQLADYPRPSRVPPRAVLGTTTDVPDEVPGRDWHEPSNRLIAALGNERIRLP